MHREADGFKISRLFKDEIESKIASEFINVISDWEEDMIITIFQNFCTLSISSTIDGLNSMN